MPDQEFCVDKQITVIHGGGGWKYVASSYDDHIPSIKLEYFEPDSLSPSQTFEGLWPESARKLGMALIELANQLEPDSQTSCETPQEELQRHYGFMAGLAYSQYGEEAFNAMNESKRSEK